MKRYIEPAIIIFLTGLGLFTLFALFTPSSPQVKPETVKPIDSRILVYTNEIGIPETNLQEAHAQVSNDPNICNGNNIEANEGVLACYQPSSHTLYVPIGLLSSDPMKIKAVIAHEYLHFIWDVKRIDKQKDCGTTMNYYNDSNQLGYLLKRRMEPYNSLGVGSIAFCDELHSILGTEVSDSEMPQTEVDYYKQYLPNRNALPSYY